MRNETVVYITVFNETVVYIKIISLPQHTVAMVLFRTVLQVSCYHGLLSSWKRCYHGGAQHVFIKLKT